jgi:hypothetical protein
VEVLAVLADDRRRAIVREFSHARHLRPRRRFSTAIRAFAAAADALVRWKEQRISK